MTPTNHIAQAKQALDSDEPNPSLATAHALIAIAELIATNTTELIVDSFGRGAIVTAEAVSTVLDVTGVVPSGVGE